MAQEVTIAGATYSSVPSISVPDSNNVFHPFVDPSVTTATASDVTSGKVFIASDGTQTTGTASGNSSPKYGRYISSSDTNRVWSVSNNHFKFYRSTSSSGTLVPLTGVNNNLYGNGNFPKLFTIYSGDIVRVVFYNVSNPDNMVWNANAKQANTATSLTYGLGDDAHLDGIDRTFTAPATKDVGCWFVYVQNNLGTLEFDYKIYVNGEWVC